MKKLQSLLILLVAGALFVPAVSATIIFDEQKTFSVDFSQHEWAEGKVSSGIGATSTSFLYFEDIQQFTDLKHFVAIINGSRVDPGSIAGYANNSIVPVVGTIGDNVIFTGRIGHNINYNKEGGLENVIVWIEGINDFNTYSYTGSQTLSLTWDTTRVPIVGCGRPMAGFVSQSSEYIQATFRTSKTGYFFPARYEYLLKHTAKNDVRVVWNDTYIDITVNRYGDYSTLLITETGTENVLISTTQSSEDLERSIPMALLHDYVNPSIDISLDIPDEQFLWRVAPYGDPGDPDEEPDDQPVLRQGTVTMTDHNGTPITGFDVMAVNAYTGQAYNVSTDTDIAVISLPMDRTTTIRNPQTGVYEETAVGYYRFFGQAPGYKMVNEGGIQVAVMPEKYGSYQLCDILVTSESGYLTGQHKFQIRSRSDNSILQTGTISAKSATTGEWYNTTLSGGIATLILPYDTSNPISQYAGNYYVYATSPGYEDSDYGTQIVVMPHTVSEIHDIHLTPIGGVPTPGNVTLRIQAFSETGPGVVNASIFIAGVIGEGASVWDTYTASSTGYLEISVPGNSTYDIVASGAGYYDSARRIEVLDTDPPLIEIKLYLSGAPTLEPTTQPTGWPTTQPTTQPTGIPDDDDGSESFLMQAVRGIGLAFGVGFSTAKIIFGMLLALSIGFATAKHLRGGAAEFGIGLLGGTLLGVLIGLLPVWIIVVLLLVVGLYIGNRYVGGANNG